MNQAVYAVFNADEHPENGDVLDLSLNLGADRIFFTDGGPGVDFGLLDAEGNPPVSAVNTKHNCLNLIAGFKYFRGMPQSSRPGHFGNMDQPFHSFFKGNKGAVSGKTDYVSADPGTNYVFLLDVQPRVCSGLLQTEGNLPLGAVIFQHHHIDMITDFDDL